MLGDKEQYSIEDALYEIGKIVEGAITGKTDVTVSYSRNLAEKLERAGHSDSATRIRNILSNNESKTVSTVRAKQSRQIPVDGESRLAVADEEYFEPDSIGICLGESQQEALERFFACFEAADRLAAHGLEMASSMLVYGPPGCGKTQFANFIASKVGLPIVTARMDSLISSYLGSTAKNIRALFDYASSHPCVLFLDEFDALAKMRDDSRELGELKRVVISLLQNIDILGRNHILIAATNHAHLLDQAVWRRFATRLYLGFPDAECRRNILCMFLRNMADNDVVEMLVGLTAGESGAQIRDIAEEAVRHAVINQKDSISTEDARDICVQLIRRGEEGVEEMIYRLYSTDRKTYTQLYLAELFGMSQPKVSRILKERRSERAEEEEATSN
tara:strand:+ start:245946 stop:247115 length:1170 start_codon:yes stop_codon:yes gene_type:complete